MKSLDETDRRIVILLQKEARLSNAEIARRIGMAPSAVFERIRKLETNGVIRAYEARLNPSAVNCGLLAYVSIRSDQMATSRETEQLLAALPEIQELHHITGEDAFLAKVRVPDTEALDLLLRDKIYHIPGIRGTRTTIVLTTAKETLALPLNLAEEDASA